MKNFSVLLIAISVVSACSSKLEDPEQPLSANQTLQITTSKPSLLSNASDTMSVYAQIPKDAGRMDISFTTTKGSFVQSDAKTIKQWADSVSGNYRYARTVLKSDSSQGTVYITAETGSERNRISINFN